MGLKSQIIFELNRDDAIGLTAVAQVPSSNMLMLFKSSQMAFYPLTQAGTELEWLTVQGLDQVTAAVNNGQDELLLFDGSYYVRFRPSTGTLLSDWELWPNLPQDWRSKVTAAFNWDVNSMILLNGDQYVIYDFEQQAYTGSGSVSAWPGWPQYWTTTVDAAVNLGDGFIYFFSKGEVAPYQIQEQTFYQAVPLYRSENEMVSQETQPSEMVQVDASGCFTGNPGGQYNALRSPLVGNTTGNPIEDNLKTSLAVFEIKVYLSKVWGKTIVCGLQTSLKDQNGGVRPQSVFGKTSSTFKIVNFGEGECLTGISGTVGGETGSYLNSIQIQKSTGSSEVFGNKFVKDAEPYTVRLDSDAVFDGFFGYANNGNISAIGLKYFGQQNSVSRVDQVENNATIANPILVSRNSSVRQYTAGGSSINANQAMQLGMGVPPTMIEGMDEGNQNDAISSNEVQIVDAYIDDYDDFTSELGNMAEFMVQPLSGIDWLGAGFDILYYDPLNPNDLKPRKSFRTVLVTNSPARAGNKNQYLKPFGSEFYSANSGSNIDSTSWVRSYQQFTNSFNIGMSTSVSLPKGASGSFSPSYSEMNSTSIGSEKLYSFNKIRRKIHEVALNLTWVDNAIGQKYKQKLDSQFKNDVAELPVPNGPVNRIEIIEKNQKLPTELSILQGKYYGLIQKYGTHFAQRVAYGGQYISRTLIKRSQYEKTRMTQAEFEAKAEATIKGVTVGNTVNFGYSDGSTTQKGNQAFRRDVFVQGGNGEDDMEKWRNKVDENLAPIEIFFAPISEILQPNMFDNDPDIEKKSQLLAMFIDKYVTDKYREGLLSKDDFFRDLPDLPMPGNVMVKNGGGYVMWFTVKYEYQGQWVTKESGNFTLGFTRDIEIPVEAKNITITAEQTTGEIFTETLEKPEIVCFKCWGTIFSTNYSKCDE